MAWVNTKWFFWDEKKWKFLEKILMATDLHLVFLKSVEGWAPFAHSWLRSAYEYKFQISYSYHFSYLFLILGLSVSQ